MPLLPDVRGAWLRRIELSTPNVAEIKQLLNWRVLIVIATATFRRLGGLRARVVPATVLVLMVTLVLTPATWSQYTEKVLYTFSGGDDGANPWGGIVFDSHGNLYGTARNAGADGAGVAFELSPPAGGNGPWTYTVLYTFTGGSDGSGPIATLIFDSEFNYTAHPDPTKCGYEEGYVRHHEPQYYTVNRLENARVGGQHLLEEGSALLNLTAVLSGNTIKCEICSWTPLIVLCSVKSPH